MKAIKIDVEKQTVSFIEIGEGIDAINEAIGNDCRMLTSAIDYPNGDYMYCDDEALLSPENIKGAFIYPDWQYPIVSNAIILGTDEYGESVDCKSRLEDIKQDIEFISIENKALQRYINQFA